MKSYEKVSKKKLSKYSCVKSAHIRSFSGPYFPVFGLNTERSRYLSAFSRNTGKCKIQNRNTSPAVIAKKIKKN